MHGGFRRRPRAAGSLFSASAALILLIGGWAPQAAPAAPAADGEAVPPVVPGYYHRLAAKAEPAELGEILLGELNCLQCHAAEASPQRILTKGAPDLSKVGARVTPQWIREYVANPHASKPGNTMPDIFHSSAAQAKEGAVEFLTHYLVSLGGPIDPAATAANDMVVQKGKDLYHTVGCVACHDPEQPLNDPKVPSVPLGKLAKKYTTTTLTGFLMDPHSVRPGGRMPYSNLQAGEAEAIAVYLLREQITNPQSKNAGPARKQGLKYIYYDKVQAHTADVKLVDPLKPLKDGDIENFTLNIPGGRENNNFVVKYSGILSVRRAGKYTFYTTSDDGTHLYIDGNKVVDNDGTHPPQEKSGAVELTQGDHEIVLTYFQGGGEAVLSVAWEGPEIQKQPIPNDVLYSLGGQRLVPLETEDFKLDPEKAQMGGRMFTMMGCASCHAIEGVRPMKEYKPLAQLNLDSPTGCLAPQPAKGVPHYRLSAEQNTALKAAVKNAADFSKPLEANPLVHRTMAAMNCYACHVRDEIGGPSEARRKFFTMTSTFDMGEEGYIPPRLTEAGMKLKPEAMHQIIFEGKLHVRPVMATRMPQFNPKAIGFVVDAFQKADTREPVAAAAGAQGQQDEPPFDEKGARDGRTLVGTKGGLGCVNCHSMAGNKSLGMPGPDLAASFPRLKHKWFTELLHNPHSKNPGTRMPAFWHQGGQDIVAFPDLAGGKPRSQQDAIWTYLALGKDAPLPVGLQVAGAGGFELVVGGEPLIHRTFMAEVGTRAILVGFPENIHVAFDGNTPRLAKAWRGKFFDAKGMWEGRGGQHFGPLGADAINLPAGPAFAVLPAPDAAWPIPKDAKERNVGGARFLGYRLDKAGQPIFRYTVNGVEVEEQPVPVLRPGGSQLVRRFSLKSSAAVPNLFFLAAQGAKIEPKGEGAFLVDGKVTVRLPKGMGSSLRDGPGGKLLIVPVEFKETSASFDVEMAW